MAESAVSIVLSQLASLVTQEAAVLLGVRDQVEWVKIELQLMKGFLKDAESRRRGDERVESWISEMRGVTYEMEDIIDTVKYMAERQRQRRGFMGSISRYSHKPYEFFTLHKIGSDIENLREKIRVISEKGARYGIANLCESGVEKFSDRDDHLQALREMPDHFFDDNDVIGFEDDKKELVKLLVDPENKNRGVISIVGMGGLGKTTLARKVYDMAEVKQHFHTYVWLTITQKYDVKAILKDIVKNNIPSVTKEELEEMTERELKEKLYNFFQDKKYFVVMDDVWEVPAWERIGQVFPNGNNGSRILLTTRHMEVARHAEPWIPPHELHLLNDTHGLELLCRKAFPQNEGIPAELVELARELAKTCGGLPLALVVLGGLLSSKDRTYHAYWKVAQSMKRESTGAGQQCLRIFGLTYNDLPYPLKSCFLYITAFPEDSIISASKLVRLWIAEGFILQEQGQIMEDTAMDWLNELVRRCMIQVVERTRFRRRVKNIRIHNMLREFGQSEARKDGFLHVCSSDMAISGGITSYRAAFHNRINKKVAVSSPHLRTLLGFNLVLKGSTAAGRFLNKLNLLRVLDLEGARDLEELPEQMGNMIQLRYLGLRNTGLKRLPSSVGRLPNLQTLDVRGTEIKWYSKSSWRIRTLRHLYIHTFMLLSTLMIGDQNNLQTLQIMDHPHLVLAVRATATPDGPDSIQKPRYKMLEKSLRIALQDSLASLTLNFFSHPIPGDVIFAEAPKLYRLHSLNLEGRLLLKQQQLSDRSPFPPNLVKLVLTYSELKLDPMLMLEKLQYLSLLELRFDAYLGKGMLCSAGGFPKLQHLTIHGQLDLEEWRVEVGAMPSLTHLTIMYCKKLKLLPEGLKDVTTLRELKLIGMLRQFNDRVRNEDRYKIQHIPSIIFENEHHWLDITGT